MLDSLNEERKKKRKLKESTEGDGNGKKDPKSPKKLDGLVKKKNQIFKNITTFAGKATGKESSKNSKKEESKKRNKILFDGNHGHTDQNNMLENSDLVCKNTNTANNITNLESSNSGSFGRGSMINAKFDWMIG